MSEVQWPRHLRKCKPYTKDELLDLRCLTVAKAILRQNEGSELIHVRPPDNARRLGCVYPPSGGEIGEWYDHYVVRIEGHYYDCMTGPAGMDEATYRALFEHGNELVFEKAKHDRS